MDIFSRYVVGWIAAHREKKALAKRLIKQSCMKRQIEPGQMTLHADRGSSMKSKVVAQLLADLGVTKTHSRPHVSNDNPYSESQFRTLKYFPQFPQRFGSIQDCRVFCQDFISWYNKEHRHSGIALMTPKQVHYEGVLPMISPDIAHRFLLRLMRNIRTGLKTKSRFLIRYRRRSGSIRLRYKIRERNFFNMVSHFH